MRVLFVCTENSGRSQIAEAFTNMLGADGVEAYSACPEPGEAIVPQAVEVMSELGYGLESRVLMSVDELPDVVFDYVVTMNGEECPMVKTRMHIEWDIPDPRGMGVSGFRHVRDTIRERVQRLLTAPRALLD